MSASAQAAAESASMRIEDEETREPTQLVTGARVKIGYEIALKLLRAGAAVVATTRFPHDAVLRYSQEADFAQWRDRLHVYAIDLRLLGDVERFVRHLEATYPRLDVLIN